MNLIIKNNTNETKITYIQTGSKRRKINHNNHNNIYNYIYVENGSKRRKIK